jgi:hypothetical protein
MAAALDTGFIAGLLQGLGVDAGAARIAGAKLSVVVGLFGGGTLLIGLSWLARASRIRHAWSLHAELMAEIAEPMGGRIQHFEGQGLGFWAEVRGLRLQVYLEPTGEGALSVLAHCPPQQAIQVWPLGMGPANPGPQWRRIAEGSSWELWAQVVLDGAEPGVDPVLSDALDGAFGAGGASQVRHDVDGIHVQMSYLPGLDPRNRVPLAVEAAIALARFNH